MWPRLQLPASGNTRAAGRGGDSSTRVVASGLNGQQEVTHLALLAVEGGRRRCRWALTCLCPHYADCQRNSPGSYMKKLSTPSHLSASQITACAVSGGPPQPMTATVSCCMPLVWHGLKFVVNISFLPRCILLISLKLIMISNYLVCHIPLSCNIGGLELSKSFWSLMESFATKRSQSHMMYTIL